jgi:hypothetical protein
MLGTVGPRTGAQLYLVLASLVISSLAIFPIAARAQTEVRELRFARHGFFETADVRERHIRGRILVASGPDLPAATVGQNYRTALAVRRGVAPYRFAIIHGTLPSGVSLDPTTGSISGKPAAKGTYRFHIRVTDAPRSDVGEKWLTIVASGTAPAPSPSLVVNPTTSSVSSGKTQQFSAIVRKAANTAVTWHASIGSISSTGLYTAPQVSSSVTATITAASASNPTVVGTATVTISPATPARVQVSLNPSSTTVASGKIQQFTALVSNTSNTSVTWKASSGSISSTGLYTAPKVSSNTAASVTATSVAAPMASASATVTVTAAAPSALTIATTVVPAGSSGSAYGFALGANGGTIPYSWSIGSGALPSGITLTANGMISGSTSQTGQFSFVAQVTDASSPSQRATQSFTLNMSGAPTPTGAMDGPAQLPRVFLQTQLVNTPAAGQVWNVNSSTAFQQALNSAACGDTIQLQAGVVFSGVFTIPAKPCDSQHWIMVRTSAPDTALPAEGVRLTPCYAGVTSLPGRPALKCSSTQNVMPKIVYSGVANGPIQFAVGANHYRFVGLEITRATGTGPASALISNVGKSDSLVFDRVWVHGTATDETRRGLQLGDSTNVAVVDSYFSDFHCTAVTGTCSDSQAISGGTSSVPTGPYKIVNNFLEAAGENVIFGGGPAATTPADIEVRRNHFFKPMTWMPGAPGFIGTAFIVKNHFELKNAQRVLVEANIFENSWGGFSQSGFSILLTPKNQAIIGAGNVCPICQVTDVTIRYNTISHVGGGLQIANAASDLGGLPLDGQRYSIHDIIVDDIDGAAYSGNGTFAQVSTVPQPILQNVSINHITAFPQKTLLNIGGPTNPKMPNFMFTNSIVMAGIYPVWSTGGGIANCAYYDIPLTTVTACFSPYAFTGNAIIATPTAFPSSKWPTGNAMPTSATNVQFANFNGGNGGNYQLLASSPYKNAATDGKDMGADVNAIMGAIAGVP